MENFDINRFFRVFLNNKLYIFIILTFFIAVGYFYSFYYVTPKYTASSTVVLIQSDELLSSDSSITQSDITLNRNLVSTYTKIAKSDKVIDKVIDNLDLDISTEQLSNSVSIKSANNTEVFKVSVNNANPTLAASITNELVSVFSEEIKTLYNMNNVYVMDKAEVPTSPYNINHTKDLILFAMIGMAISFGLVTVIYLLDTTIKSENDVKEYTTLNVLSSIPLYINEKNVSNTELIVNEQPKSPISECFKAFRTNVLFSIQNRNLNTILVTSGYTTEGKSFVSSNLAVTFAQSGKNVILIDTDMRKGRQHKIFGVSSKCGLSNCLSNIAINGKNVNINEYIKETSIPNLHIMTTGDVPPNPSELLSSDNMHKLLKTLGKQYDIVICDGTPSMLVSDSIILSKIVDTTIIVTANKQTKLDTLLKIKKSIDMVGGNIGGVVINKMPIKAKEYKNHYYYGEHSDSTNVTCKYSLATPIKLSDNLYIIDDEIIPSNVEDTNVSDSLNDSEDISTILNKNMSDIKSELIKEKELYKNDIKNIVDKYNLHRKDTMLELNNIKNLYNDSIIAQNKQIEALNNKIDSIEFTDNSDIIMNELNSIKDLYNDSIIAQNKQIEALNNKIDSIEFTDNSDIVMNELNSIKDLYNDSIIAQNKQIEALNDKVDNIEFTDNSDIVINELNSIKDLYNDSIIAQNKQIEALNDKVDNIEFTDNSDIVMNELNNIKNLYNENITAQNKQIEALNNKVDNIEFTDNSDVVMNELNIVKDLYNYSIDRQNEQIQSLNNKIDNLEANDNSLELLKVISDVCLQLSNINSKFEHLENKISANEELINKMYSNINNKSESNKPLKELYRINDKVIKLQDYLETSYQNNTAHSSSRKNRNLINGQINILDELIDNSINTNKTVYNQIDYEKIENKSKKIFNFFKYKNAEPVDEEEEPIVPVSQILSGTITNVG